MKRNDQATIPNPLWVQMCQATGLEPEQRLTVRQAILNNKDAQDCTVYRPDEHDPEAEEEDLGDARILFCGPFQAPEEWDEQTSIDYFDETDPELFVTALIECEAAPNSRHFFAVEAGDYIATTLDTGEVAMFYVHDCRERECGRHCVLIRDDEPLF